MRSLLTALALSSVAFGLFAPAALADGGGPQFGLRPLTYDPAVPETRSYFVFDGQPGATLHSQVRIVNNGNRAGGVRLYGVDGATGQTSGTVFPDDAAPRTAVGSWLSLDSRELTLGPGESQIVDFSVTVPAEVRPGHHVGGIVAEDLTIRTAGGSANDATSAAVQFNIRQLFTLAVQVNLPGPRVEVLEATGVRSGGEGGYQQLFVGLKNSGTTMLKPSGTIRVSDSQGQIVQDIALKLDTFLPQTAIDYPVFVERQGLGAGSYQASLALDYGDRQQLQQLVAFAITSQQVEQAFAVRQPPEPPAGASGVNSVQQSSLAPLAVGFGAAMAILLVGALGLVLPRRRSR